MRLFFTVAASIGMAASAGCGSDAGSPQPAQTGTIAGTVVDVDSGGAGLSGVSVRLESSEGAQTVTTGAAGAFGLSNAAVGSWQVAVQLPSTHRLDAGEAGTRTATVSSGQTATLSAVRLARPRGSVSGSVLLDGAGTASGSIAATRGGFTTRNQAAGAAGAYTIANLAAGPWTLAYTPGSGHALAENEAGTRTVTVAEGQVSTVPAFRIAPAATEPVVVEIHLTTSTQFAPSSVTIAPGTTVRWINDFAMAHTITPQNAEQAGVWTRRTTSSAGVVFEHTFTVPNQTYLYRCEPHSADFTGGMVGVITVTT